jgi:hypothetical protein
MQGYLSFNGSGQYTASSGTAITVPIGGEFPNLVTNILNLNYLAGATAHTLTLMRGTTWSTIPTAVAAGGTSVTTAAVLLNGAGQTIQANDIVAIQLDNWTWFTSTVSSVSGGNLTLVLNTAVPSGRSVPANAVIVEYGQAGDAFHAHQQYAAGASATTNVPNGVGPLTLCKATHQGQPIVVNSNNATNAGTLEYINWAYTGD